MNNYVKNSFWILIEKMSRIISGILVGVLVARYLGPDQFGLISYALNVVAIFTIISTLGLDSLIVRELIMRNDKQHVILGTAFIMRLLGSIVVVAASTTYSFMRDTPQQTMIVFLVSLSIVMQSFTVVDFYFQSKVKGRFTAMNQVITLLTSAMVKLGLIYYHAPLIYFASMVLFEATISFFLQYLFYKKNDQHIKLWKFSFEESKILISHAWPIILSAFVLILYQKMDQILIKRFLNINLVGQYAAAIRISEASYFIPVAICAAIFPGIVNARNNKELQIKRLTQLYSILIYTALFISICGLIFGDFVIGFLYKDQFPLSPMIFKIHIWATIPIFFGTAWGAWILVENKQIYLFFLQVLSLSMCFYLNMKLIPLMGITGSAISIVATYYFGFLTTNLLYKPKFSLQLLFNALHIKNIFEVVTYIKANLKNK